MRSPLHGFFLEIPMIFFLLYRGVGVVQQFNMEKEEENDLDNMEDEKLEQNSETESKESENSSMEYEISNNESDEDLVNFSEISLDDVGTGDPRFT